MKREIKYKEVGEMIKGGKIKKRDHRKGIRFGRMNSISGKRKKKKK